MRIRSVFLALVLLLVLVTGPAFASFSENSRQGSGPIFSISGQGVSVLFPAPTPGFDGSASENRVRVNFFGKKLTPYLFTGRRLDAFTNQYFNRWRHYNPKVGRFTSQDPIGFDGGNNLYAYANQNPLRYADPMGLVWVYSGWKAWAYTEISYTGGTAKTFTLTYLYDPRTSTWVTFRKPYLTDYFKLKTDWWTYEETWIPEFPFCPKPRPFGLKRTSVAPRYWVKEGPFSMTTSPSYYKISTNPGDQATKVWGAATTVNPKPHN